MADAVSGALGVVDMVFHGLGSGGFGIIILLLAWSLVWKGLALWRAAKRGHMWWFIAFLVIHTLGLLEIIYIFGVTKARLSDFTHRREAV
jgi:hypothetical protein